MRLHPNSRRLAGFRAGRLVAVRPVAISKDGHVVWLCRCDCGRTKRLVAGALTRGKGGTRSCGCLRSDAHRQRVKRDGAWNEGKSYAIGGGERCYKTRHSWAKAVIRHYGNKCQRCGWAEGRCDADHIVEKGKGGKHTIKNGRVLCPNCHRIRHEGKR